MPRTCSICAHKQRPAIDKALVAREALLGKYLDLLRQSITAKRELVRAR